MATARTAFNVVYEVDDRGVQKLLRRMDTALDPTAIAAFMGAVIHPYIQKRAKGRFASEGDDVSGKWDPLKEATNSFRIHSQPSYPPEHPINARTGELERYITQSNPYISPTPAGAVYRYPGAPAKGELRTKVETAQIGKPDPNTRPRPVLGMNENDLAFVVTALATYIQVGQ